MRILVLVGVLVLVPQTALAQPPGETAPTAALVAPPGESPPVPPPRKSLLTAYLITIAATSLPITISAIINLDDAGGARETAAGVLTSAAWLGPSAGHWYAGRGMTTGLAMRLGAAGGIAVLAIADPQLEQPATVMALVGAAALLETGVIWDLVTLPRAIRRYNAAHALTLAPMLSVREPVAGLAVGGAF